MIAIDAHSVGAQGPETDRTRSGFAQDRGLRTFLGLYYEMLEELANEGFFTQGYGTECADGHPIFWCEKKIQKKIEIHDIGIHWPLLPGDLSRIDNETAIRYLEFLYTCVSKPTDGWDHSYCEGWHPTEYDQALGRLEYEARLNQALGSSKLGWEMHRGKVQTREDKVLWDHTKVSIAGSDRQIELLLENAIEQFASGTEANRLCALGSLANAYERLKENLGSGNKRNAVGGLKLLLGFEQAQVPDMDALFKAMTDIANNTSIRHHEESRASLVGQPEMVEFLFYSFYNLVRLCLSAKRRLNIFPS